MVYNLEDKDLQIIENKGFDKSEIFGQIEKIKEGIKYSELVRPAGFNDGLVKLSRSNENFYLSLYEEKKSGLKIIKFIPASGAASRMFQDLLTYYNDVNLNMDNYINEFISGLKNNKFAFTEKLNICMKENDLDMVTCIQNSEIRLILKYLLTVDGLNYANLPKAVLNFHFYNGTINTPIDEHISEGLNYAKGIDDKTYLHFTISGEFENIFQKYLNKALDKTDINKGLVDITLSEQKDKTQTIALNDNDKLFKTEVGDILFRPGGHGALIENLNGLDGDIIYIKNIDNVVINKYSDKTNYYKKVLGGYLIEVKDKVFEIIRSFESKDHDNNSIIDIINYCKNVLNISFIDELNDYDVKKKIKFIKKKLSRPIRVCGMVKNEGEPGGGPFWVKKNNEVSLQIIEGASVNKSDEGQNSIFNSAEFFNPVDIICSVKDHKGNKYNLKNFVDNETFFVSEKSKDGKKLKALELPGLWNGAMADWVTIFIEVPLITFNPVKTVNDLLKPNHQN